jgi:hypothetical protein
MRGTRHRSSFKSIVAVLCAACFLTVSLGAVSRAIAADAFETWPKKTTEPGVAPKPVPDASGAAAAGDASGAAAAGDAAGKQAETGLSSGTIGWIAAGAAAILLIAIAAGSGGSESTSNH